MSLSMGSRSLLIASRSISRPNVSFSALYSLRRRGFADVATDDMSLPLKGYKVLDMTRVLAGVCDLIYKICPSANKIHSHTVLRF